MEIINIKTKKKNRTKITYIYILIVLSFFFTLLLFFVFFFFHLDFFFFFFFNDTATTEIYTLSLHDALPICLRNNDGVGSTFWIDLPVADAVRSEEHTSELQSRQYLVCRLLLEKKKQPPTQVEHITNKKKKKHKNSHKTAQ